MEMTDKNKKQLWIGGVIVAVLYFAPNIVNQVHGFFAPAHASVQTKPSPAIPMPPKVIAAANPSIPPEAASKFGVWEATQFTPTHDQCRIRLEIRPDRDAQGKISGYESRSCWNVQDMINDKLAKSDGMAAIRASVPVATTMTGDFAGGVITFHIDTTVGTSRYMCNPLRTYTVSTFGDKAIVAAWTGDACPAGQIVMGREGA